MLPLCGPAVTREGGSDVVLSVLQVLFLLALNAVEKARRFLPAHLARAACGALGLANALGVPVSGSVSWALPVSEPMPSVAMLAH